MSIQCPLIEPRIVKETLLPNQYSTLPENLRMIAKNYTLIYRVTITPRKREGALGVKTNILAPPSFRMSGNVILENAGRLPLKLPTGSTEDLRPITFYAFGSGTYKFRVNLESNRSIYVETLVNFD